MYHGVFLNLRRNEQRRTALVRHLAEVGAAERYQWFEAIDGQAILKQAPAGQYETKLQPGNLGLWLSHEKLIQSLGAAPQADVHILEDDAVLAKNAVAQFDGLLARIDREGHQWDLLFTDVFLTPHTAWFRQFAEKLQLHAQTGTHTLVDLARIPFAGTSSLFVNKASLGKYAALLAGNWRRGLPIDLYLRTLVNQGQLKAYVTVPYMTSISPASNTSDISGDLPRSRMICDLYRRAFFQEANLAALMSEMESLTAGARVPPLAALYLHAESFMLSDQWVPF